MSRGAGLEVSGPKSHQFNNLLNKFFSILRTSALGHTVTNIEGFLHPSPCGSAKWKVIYSLLLCGVCATWYVLGKAFLGVSHTLGGCGFSWYGHPRPPPTPTREPSDPVAPWRMGLGLHVGLRVLSLLFENSWGRALK